MRQQIDGEVAMGEATQQLRMELGGQVPDGLDALSEADAGRLARAVREARARQARQLDVAVDESLRVVPFLLRGAVKKILFG
ncbi:MAG: hypothetical protein ACRDT4_15690 [Micromonosporaceae bacterium]